MTKCIGCGSVLQNKDPNKEGYVIDLSKELCERCFKIRHYNEYRFIDKDNNYYLEIIKNIEKTKDLVVVVTDFLNISSLNELNITNPVLLVISKKDLIPRSLDENKLLNNIKSNLNIKDKIVVCSNNNYNLDLLFDKIKTYKQTNNVYVVGYTNAGKSTLINALIKNYSDNKNTITTSVLPSTTLDLIEIKIDNELTIIDTPGLLDEGSIFLKIKDKTLKNILPKKEIKPIVIQVKLDQTIIIGKIFRIDVKKGTDLIFYMSNDLPIERFYKETDILKNLPKQTVHLPENNDLIIKGLGFIKTTKACDIILYLDDDIKFIKRNSII